MTLLLLWSENFSRINYKLPNMLTMELQCLIPRINDDNIDNFHIELRPKQYADIEEDEPILHPCATSMIESCGGIKLYSLLIWQEQGANKKID